MRPAKEHPLARQGNALGTLVEYTVHHHHLPIKDICNDITPIICEIDLNVLHDGHEIGHLASRIHVGEISPLKRFTHHLNGPQDIGTGHITLVQTTVGTIHTLGMAE